MRPEKYDLATSFNHKDYRIVSSTCIECGHTITEGIADGSWRATRVRCHLCLASWWNAERHQRRRAP